MDTTTTRGAARCGDRTHATTHRSSSVGEHVGIATSRDDWEQGVAVLHDHAAWIRTSTGIDLLAAQPAFARELADLEAAYSPPDGLFLVARDGWLVRGVVAIRLHPDGSAELKRMYVRPVARRRGWAGRLVEAAVEHAEAAGATHVWLETLPGVMDPAIALYRRHGFDHDRARPTIDVDGAIRMRRWLRQPAAA